MMKAPMAFREPGIPAPTVPMSDPPPSRPLSSDLRLPASAVCPLTSDLCASRPQPSPLAAPPLRIIAHNCGYLRIIADNCAKKYLRTRAGDFSL